VVLVNLGDQPYRVEKGDRIAQLIIEKIDNRELQEVTQLDYTKRGDQGFGSSNTTMDQEVTGQSAKTGRKNSNSPMDQEVTGQSAKTGRKNSNTSMDQEVTGQSAKTGRQSSNTTMD